MKLRRGLHLRDHDKTALLRVHGTLESKVESIENLEQSGATLTAWKLGLAVNSAGSFSGLRTTAFT